jgi:hypothetical protein
VDDALLNVGYFPHSVMQEPATQLPQRFSAVGAQPGRERAKWGCRVVVDLYLQKCERFHGWCD